MSDVLFFDSHKHTPPFLAPTCRSAAVVLSPAGTPPATRQTGDVIVATLSFYGDPTSPAPTGFTMLQSTTFPTEPRQCEVFQRAASNTVADALDPNYFGPHNSAVVYEVALVGLTTATLTAGEFDYDNAAGSVTIPAVTASAIGFDLLFVSGNNSGSITTPSGFSLLANSNVASGTVFASTFIRPITAGSTGTTGVTTSGNQISGVRVVATA